MTNILDEQRLQGLVDRIYGIEQTADDCAFMAPLFEALRPLLSFSTAVYLPIDPGDWMMRAGHAHDCEPQVACDYLAHYQAFDPYVIYAPCLRNPGTAIRFSDVADISRVARGEYGPLMRKTPFYHALAVVPFIRGMPFAVFSVHRRRRDRDFDEPQRQIFQWFSNHVAMGIDYRLLQRRLHGASQAGAMVLSRNGQILAIDEEAQSALERLAPDRKYTVPAAADPPRIWRRGMEAFVVRSAPLPATSLLAGVESSHARMSAAARRFGARLKRLPGQSPEQLLVTVEPIDRAAQAAGEIFGFKFAPQEKRVAILLVKGYTPKQIAEAMALSLGTVREYIQACYRRVSAKSLEEFVRMIRWGIDSGEK